MAHINIFVARTVACILYTTSSMDCMPSLYNGSFLLYLSLVYIFYGSYIFFMVCRSSLSIVYLLCVARIIYSGSFLVAHIFSIAHIYILLLTSIFYGLASIVSWFYSMACIYIIVACSLWLAMLISVVRMINSIARITHLWIT